jgi:hypothetical protein
MPWVRKQSGRPDSVGRLARALAEHENNLAEGQRPPDSWVKLLSRINRGELGRGRGRLREAVEHARQEFSNVVLPHEAKRSAEFREAAE